MGKVKHTTLVESTAQQIKEMIQAGEFKIGEKLPSEESLCKKLNVSRPTLREAYRMLDKSGFVELSPGRGAFVKVLDENERRKLLVGWFRFNEEELVICFKVRENIELIAVKLFAERATDRELHELLGVNLMFQSAVKSGDAGKMAVYDEMFHSVIVNASRSKTLITMSEQISSFLESYRHNAFTVPGSGSNAEGPHNEIVQALMQKDVEAAEAAMSRHLKISLADIESVIEKCSVIERNDI